MSRHTFKLAQISKNSKQIAALLNEKFPDADVRSLTDAELFAMMESADTPIMFSKVSISDREKYVAATRRYWREFLEGGVSKINFTKGNTVMKTYDDILNAVVDHGAMIVRPATAKDLKQCQKEMKEMSFPPIPQGYCDFLSMLNGFAWNGIEFFSTDQVTDPETNFMLNDIVSANEHFVEVNDDFLSASDYVLLGRSDMDIYVYNTKNGRYEVLDIDGRDVMEDFEAFEAMFVGVAAPRI